MDTKEQIDKAMVAHGMWKMRLRIAINSGQSDFDPLVVRTDNQCEFGKWLYSLQDTSSPFYEQVRTLHASFHTAAADVLTKALNGNSKEALSSMNVGGDYDQISSALSDKLQEWKDNA